MDELETEHRRLLDEHAALEAEHVKVHDRRGDHAAHAAHIARLRDHKVRLRLFHARLREAAAKS